MQTTVVQTTQSNIVPTIGTTIHPNIVPPIGTTIHSNIVPPFGATTAVTVALPLLSSGQLYLQPPLFLTLQVPNIVAANPFLALAPLVIAATPPIATVATASPVVASVHAASVSTDEK